jgi:spore germination cell wall hydrolase CwlJ-like protein
MKAIHEPIFRALTVEQLMALCIQREAAGEPTEGKIAVGTVILERVDHRKWDGTNIPDVILFPWAFSWTMPQAGVDYYNASVEMARSWDQAYRSKASLRESYQIACGMIAGTIPRDPDLARYHCCQYLNPKTAPAARIKWLANGMTPIKTIENHEFFRTNDV